MSNSYALVLTTLVVEAVALLVTLLLIFGHGAWLWWDARGSHSRLGLGRAALMEALEAGRAQGHKRDLLRTLPARLQIKLLVEMAPSLRAGRREQLTTLAGELGLLARAEGRCLSRLWWRRLHGCRLLTLLGGGETTVPALFRDRNILVRVQAAEWAADHPSPPVIDNLLTLLADPTTLCRFTVQDSLLRMGRVVVEPLARCLATYSGMAAAAALEVAVVVADGRLLEPALILARDTSPQVRARAAALLGALGGAAAVALLLDQLHDSEPDVRAAAATALGTLAHWPAGAALAALLRDRAWAVRRAAGLALRALGAPGALYLRRALGDADRFAADMARQVLDLPEVVRAEVAP